MATEGTTIALGPGEHGAYRRQLVADTVDTVTFDDDVRAIEVFSTGEADLYVTTDGHAPAIADTRSWELPAGDPVVKIIPVTDTSGKRVVVKRVADGGVLYSVSEATR